MIRHSDDESSEGKAADGNCFVDEDGDEDLCFAPGAVPDEDEDRRREEEEGKEQEDTLMPQLKLEL